MSHKKIPIYFVPGLAAGTEIFKNISLPESDYSVYYIEWLIPKKKETIGDYAARMAKLVKHDDSVLVGVSFGGVIAQEMSVFLNLKKLIIVSSVKTKYELPRRIKAARKLHLHKFVPIGLVLGTDDLTKFAVGPKSKRRLKIYQEYLHIRDKQYLDWAIKNMICWDQKKPIDTLVHIHGDKDVVFPIKYIGACEIIEGGTHVMILNRGKEVSKRIMAAIE